LRGHFEARKERRKGKEGRGKEKKEGRGRRDGNSPSPPRKNSDYGLAFK